MATDRERLPDPITVRIVTMTVTVVTVTVLALSVVTVTVKIYRNRELQPLCSFPLLAVFSFKKRRKLICY